MTLGLAAILAAAVAVLATSLVASGAKGTKPGMTRGKTSRPGSE